MKQLGIYLFALCYVVISLVAAPVTSGAERLVSEEQLHVITSGAYYFDICDEMSDGTVGSTGGAGTGDTASIKNAKNADRSSTDVGSAAWSDTDDASMARLLDNYGELAYYTGAAYGVPWIAILVQMRYEDPNANCGVNNFWGTGCPPGTPAGGGHNYDNLAEGFIGYGETLHNGYHDQAIGVTDAKEFLSKLGPTWVQGNINGAGYAEIANMHKSVDALTKYIEDNPDSAPFAGSAVASFTYDYADGWFSNFEGIDREEVAEAQFDWDPSLGNTPNSILLHTTEGTTNGAAAYGADRQGVVAHFTIDLLNKQGYQHVPLTKASGASLHDSDGYVQIEIVGYTGEENANSHGNPQYWVQNFTDEEWDFLAKLMVAIANETGLPLTTSLEWDIDQNSWPVDLSASERLAYTGVLGHMHIQMHEDGKTDPGNIWPQLEAAIQRVGYAYDTYDACNGGGTTTRNGNILAAVAFLINMANKNGAVYKQGYRDQGELDEFIAGNYNDWRTDCSFFVTAVMYHAFGVFDPVTSLSLHNNSNYQKIEKENVQPGDVFTYEIPQGHAGMVIEVDNGTVTRIADTTGTDGQTNPPNQTLGYSDIDGSSNVNSNNTSFYRWKGGTQ